MPLSHANLSISAGNVARSYALGPADVSMCVMPLFHVHGLVASTLATLVPIVAPFLIHSSLPSPASGASHSTSSSHPSS